jgi:2-oxoisovalerate dehydrogenase E1 component
MDENSSGVTDLTELPGTHSDVATSDLLEMYRRMVRIRRFEQGASALYRDGEIPGFLHVSIGQEATAVGACWPLTERDGIVSTHRGHGHCLAKGGDFAGMFAELMGRATGTCGGYGGSMHIADIDKGMYGANGIVGAGLPIANGIANTYRIRGEESVVVAFFGDGAVGTGAFHEAVNLAAVWRLPVLFLCENNHWAEFSASETQHLRPVRERMEGYGVPASVVDGNDVIAVAEETARLVDRLRAGEGPFLLECVTYRQQGHYEGDPAKYRDPDELARWKELDPLAMAVDRLTTLGQAHACVHIDDEVAEEIEAALATARAAPPPDPPARSAPRGPDPLPEGVLDDDAPVFKTMEAVREAIGQELRSDPTVWFAGIDVGAGGNIYGLTRGLFDEFPNRVLDTPISESAIVGLAVGGAMAGSRPIVEIMYMDFIGVCLDQIMNQAAKLPFMTGGAAPMSLVIRTQMGGGRSSAAQHSQSLEALLAHIPGLVVVMPSTPADTYGLLRSAIQDPRPVVFVENRHLYGKKGPRPGPEHLVPIGKAAVRRPGAHVTVLSWSKTVDHCLAAAELAARDGIDAEVIDLRTISPLDEATIFESVSRTNRVLVVHEAVQSGGVGAEIAARVADECFWSLDAPVRRLGAPFIPSPYAPSLEAGYVPDSANIVEAIRQLAAV